MPAEQTVIIVSVALGIAIICALLIKVFFRRRKPVTSDHVLLIIKVSQVNERGPLAAEQMFASLHGLLQPSNYFAESSAAQEYLSFEIASVNQHIHFYVWVPAHLQQFVEGQIYAQYPEVEIYVAPEDYASHPDRFVTIAASELAFIAHDVLPIKEFEELEETIKKQALDSLSAITESMAKLNNPDEEIWIQVLCKPIHDKWWQKRSVYTVNALKNGRHPLKFNKRYNTVVVNPFARAALLPLKLLMLPVMLIQMLMSGPDESPASPSRGSAPDAEQDSLSEAIMEKSKKIGYRVIIRTVYGSSRREPFSTAALKLRGVAAAFKQFNTAHLNGFRMQPISPGKSRTMIRDYRERAFTDRGMLMNVKELASVMHLPNVLVQTPTIVWVTSKKLEPPSDLPTAENTPPNQLTTIGESNFRGSSRIFGIRDADRRRHVYIIGKTGMGKSTLLENMIKSDIEAGKGVGVIDPHGDLADAVLRFVPKWRLNDVIMFDPSDYEYPVALNLIESVRPEDRSKVASGFVGIFKKMFGNSWGPRLEHILRNTILALLEYPGSSILGVMRILVDKDYRDKVVSQVTDPMVRSFWLDEFANINPKNLAEVISPIQNKVGQFLSSPAVRNIIGQSRSTINIRDAMDSKKILIASLSKGKLGEDMSQLLGSLLVTKFQIDAMSRADIPEEQRVDFNLYIDEFQNFATDSFESILSEARKYHLNLTIANQYIAQLVTSDKNEGVKNAVFGNVGTLITFATGADDAEYLVRQFSFDEEEAPFIVGLDKYTIYLRLLVDNIPTKTFTARTLPSPKVTSADTQASRDKIIMLSREQYSHRREDIEAKIAKWSEAERRIVPSHGGSAKRESAPAAPRPVAAPQVDINTLTVGELIDATITGITNFGLFIEYKGIQGLVHSSELPHKHMLKDRADIFHKGDIIKAVIVGIKDDKMILTIMPEHVEPVTANDAVRTVISAQYTAFTQKYTQISQ